MYNLYRPTSNHPINNGRQIWFVALEPLVYTRKMIDLYTGLGLVYSAGIPTIERQLDKYSFNMVPLEYFTSTGVFDFGTILDIPYDQPFTAIGVLHKLTSSTYTTITCQRSGGNYNGFNWFYMNSGNWESFFGAGIIPGGLTGVRVTSPPVFDNNPHMFVVVSDGSGLSSNVRMYIDGVEYSFTNIYSGWNNGTSGTSSLPFNINTRYDSGSLSGSFNVLEFQFFKRILSKSEIQFIYYDWLSGYKELLSKPAYADPLSVTLIPFTSQYDLPIEFLEKLSSQYDIPVSYEFSISIKNSPYTTWVLPSDKNKWNLKGR